MSFSLLFDFLSMILSLQSDHFKTKNPTKDHFSVEYPATCLPLTVTLKLKIYKGLNTFAAHLQNDLNQQNESHCFYDEWDFDI